MSGVRFHFVPTMMRLRITGLPSSNAISWKAGTFTTIAFPDCGTDKGTPCRSSDCWKGDTDLRLGGWLTGGGAASFPAPVHAALAREEALGILAKYGVTTEQARERIDKLTDREVRQIANHIDNLPAGGNVALVLLIIVLVILLLEVIGFIDIFPFM